MEAIEVALDALRRLSGCVASRNQEGASERS
jgi:hypothetical protein